MVDTSHGVSFALLQWQLPTEIGRSAFVAVHLAPNFPAADMNGMF
jgi:hypothetical protein